MGMLVSSSFMLSKMMCPSVPYSYFSRSAMLIFLDDKGVWRGRVFIKSKTQWYNKKKERNTIDQEEKKNPSHFSTLTHEES